MKYIKKIILFISIVIATADLFAQHGWTVNPSDYSNSGEVVAIVYLGSDLVTSGTLGAFVGETCRGFADGILFEPTGKTVFIVMCYSNVASGETLNFKYYDPLTDSIYIVNETVPFNADMTEGDAMSPLEFHVTLNNPPVLASIGNKTVCQLSQLTFTASATDPDIPANILTFSLVGAPSGAAINSSTGEFTWTPDETQTGPFTFTVKVSDDGTPALSDEEEITVTVYVLPVPTITGPVAVCAGSTGNVYTTEAGMTGYTWAVSAGGTITAGTGTNTITVTWNTAGAQTVSVNYTNSNNCTAAIATTNNITVNSLPVPTITGPALACAGSTGNIYTTEAGMTDYTWAVSAGGTITAGAGTNTITVIWNTAGAQTVSVNYTNGNNCTAATATTNNITVNALPATSDISGNSTPACNGTGVIYSVTLTSGSSYVWTVPSGAVITSGATGPNNNQITVTFGTTNGSITVTETNAALCVGITKTLAISLAGCNLNADFTGTPLAICEGSAVTFTNASTGTTGSTTYSWTFGSGASPSTANTIGPYTVTYSTSGLKTITLIITDGASDSETKTDYITVNPLLPVSVSIAASANPVCAGTSVTFTATPVNGGTTPAYQWKVNGVNAGTNSPTYSYAPVNGDVITCVLTSDATCATGNPATSNAINMTVNPNLPVSVTIAASANPVCAGTSVTFTATPVNGGTTPAYQWKVNGVNAGINSSTYSYAPVNGDVITCVLTSNATCATGNPATSNAINMTVNPNLPVSVTIAASANPVCAGTSVTFTATPVNGGTTPAYQWKVNGVNAGTNSNTYSYTPANGDAVTCILTSNATCPTGNPATSNAVNMTVNPNLPVSVTIAASANPVCAGTSVTFTATPVNGGTTPSYQWKVNGVNAGTNSPTYSYAPVNGDVITCVLTSDATCATGNPATSNAVTMTVNPNLPVSVTIAASANPVCAGTSVTFTATPVNGGTTPAYQWKVNGVNAGTNSSTYSYAPVNGDVVTCVLTSNATCATGNPATSNAINMAVNPNLPVSVTIAASANPVCAGTSVTFTATPVNGGITPAYQWKVNGVNAGTNSPTYSYAPVNGDVITCVLTSDATCATGNPATSNAVTMTVNALPATSAITGTSTPACNGTGVIYSVTLTSGSSYAWTVPSGAVITSGATGPNNNQITVTFGTTNGSITVTETNAALCVGITKTLAISLAGCNLNADFTGTPLAICEGSAVTFTNASTGTTGSTTYSWTFGSGASPSTANTIGPYTVTYSTSGLKTITLIITDGASDSETKTDYITVNPLLPVSVSIAASANPVCAGTSVTFTATPVNGGTTPAYQWKVNGVNAGTNSPTYSYAPVNGDVITCVLTSDATCATGNPATSNAINMTVNPNLPVSVTIAASANPVCAGTSVTFTATPVNGGTTPAYQWKVNGVNAGINSSTYSYAPVNGDVITCVLTSNATCATGNPATSNAVNMTVNPNLPVSVTIAASANPVCAGTSVTFTATPVNGGTAPVYQWKVNGVNAGTNSLTYSYAPVNGDAVTCVLTSDATCATGNPATSNAVNMTVNPNLPVSVTIAASANPVCAGTSVTFTATPVNGGTTPAYQWKVNGVNAGTNSNTYSYTPANGDAVTCILTSNATCPTGNPATSNAVNMTVNPNLPVSVTIAASANPVCAGTSVTFTATPVNGGTTPSYQWKVNGVNAGTNSPTYSYAPVNGDVITCVLTSDATCATGNPATSNAVTMTVNALPATSAITGTSTPACNGTGVIYSVTLTSGSSYAWTVPSGAVITSGATGPNNNQITVTFGTTNGSITVTETNAASCVGITKTLAISLAGCNLNADFTGTPLAICEGSAVTFTNASTGTTGSTTYSWTFGSGASPSTANTIGPYTVTYSTSELKTITLIITDGASDSETKTDYITVNPLLPVSVSIAASANPVCAGTSVTFTATPVNGGTTPSYQWKVNGVNAGTNSSTYSYAPVNGDAVTCVLTSDATCATGNPATSNAVNMTVNPNLPVSVSIAASANPVCAGTSVTFTATPVNGGTTPAYQWKVNGVNAGSNSPTYSYAPVNGDVVTCVLTSNATCATGNPATSNAINMAVNPNLPVSVTIAASANPVCAGTSVTFTATPVNGGITPAYQWKVNGVNAGTNSPTYSYAPVNGDVITCVLTSDATCATGNPATSNAVTMTVNALPATSAITGTSTPACNGTGVIYSVTLTSGSSYAWTVPSGAVITSGATGPNNNQITVTFGTTNGSITVTETNAALCVGITKTLAISLAGCNLNADFTGTPLAICEGSAVTFTNASTGTTGSTTYSWTFGSGASPSTANTIGPYTVTYSTSGLKTITLIITDGASDSETKTDYITVNPLLPVSVSIAASANPVCAGTSVTFTATPVNGGTTPAYQWKVNGVNAGSNSPTYSYAPVNGDVVTCVLTSDATCATGNPATSNAINMTVNPNLPVSVTIAASANPVCAGTSVTFTATPVNGGTTPAYQWKVNGVNAGINSSTYSYAPVNGDVITCVLTSNATCATGNPATSNAVNMTVNPNLPVSVTIAASANPVCAGTSVTFTATPVNGGTTPVYQWKVNGVNAGTNSLTYSYAPVNGDAVTCVLTSDATCATGNPATSNAVNMTVNPNLPVSVSIAASANPVCAGTSVTFTATPVNGGTTPAYQWKVNGVNAGTNSNTYSYAPLNGDVVTCVLTSDATCATGNPATSNAVNMTVNPNLPVSVTIAASANPVCAGTSVTFTATPVNGGTTPAYQWKVNGVNAGTNSNTYSYAPVNGDVVTCVLTSDATCATGNPVTSNAVNMTVNALPATSAITGTGTPACNGTGVIYSVTLTSGSSYAWTVPSGAVITSGATGPNNNQITVTFGTTNGSITVTETNAALCAGTTKTLAISLAGCNLNADFTGTPLAICEGSAVTFTNASTGTTGSTTYSWTFGSGASPSTANTIGPHTITYSTSGLKTITLIITDGASDSETKTDYITVNPNLPVSVTIGASANPVCAGTSVTFTATPVNGGTTPAYQWKVNGINAGTNSNTYSYAPANGDVITCVLTSNAICPTGNPATSNAVTMTVNPNLPVSVTIAASANPVCAGTSVTFTATPVNGGTTPAYQWKVNGVNAGTNSSTYSYAPANGDVITCVLTSDATCPTGNPATSNAVTMTVNPNLPVSVTIAASANPVCAGTSVTFTATPVNGGTTPAYQWKVNGVNAGTNSSTYSYAPANGDIITCVLTSNATCPTGNPATSNAINMAVNPNLPVSVSIAASSNPVCAGTSVTFTATPVNGGTTPAYQWKVNGVNAGTNSNTYSYAPANGDAVTCVLTSDATCPIGNPATSNAINMAVNPNLPVSVTIAASANPVCAGTSVTFTATPVNGGTTPVYQWKVNGVNAGTNSNTYSYAPANGDAVTCVLTSDATCPIGNPATSNAINMAVNPNLPVSVTIAASANPVCAGTSVTFTATPVNGGTTPAYQWKVNGVNAGTNSSTYSYAPVNGDVVTCVLTSNATCATGNPATSNMVTMTVNPNLPVSVSIAASANPVCAGTSVTFTATPVNGGTTPVYQWKVNGVNAGTNSPTYSYAPLNGDVVTCVLTSDATCATGNPATSNAINMTVNPNLPVSVSIAASANPVCAGTSVTFTATPVNGGTTPAYQWKVNGVNAGTNSNTYSYAPANGDVITCVLTSNATCPTGNPATSNAVTMTVNPNLPVSVSIAASANPVCAGTSVTFTATPVNGGTTPAYQWKVNGVNAGTNSNTYSYAPANGDVITCVLTSNATCPTGNPATSNAVTMTVNPNLPVSVSIAASANPVCAGTSVTFTATPVNGGTTPAYQWKVNGVNAGTNSSAYSYAPLNGDVVTCVLTSDATCATGNPATSNAINMTINTLPVPTISGPASACAGSTGNVYTTEAGMTGYTWTVSAGGTITAGAGTNAITVTWNTAGAQTVSINYTNGNNCTAATAITKNITVNQLPAAITGTTNVCAGSTTSLSSATPGGTWSSGTLSVATINPAGVVSGVSAGTSVITYTLGTGCSITTTVTVYSIPTITGTTPNSRCGTGTVILGATASAGTINWYDVSTGGTSLSTGTTFTTPSLSVTTTYYVDATVNGCTTASRTAVVATVNTIPAITGTTPASRCGPGTVTLGAISSGGTINWYNVPTGGTSLRIGTAFTTPIISVTTTYYVDATENGCTTTPRTAVAATINPIPVMTGTTPASRCGPGTVTLGATASTGTINWYNVSTGGTSLGTGTTFTTPSLSVTTTYYADATESGCTTNSRTAVVATIFNIPLITGTTPASRCGTGTVTLGATASAGTINWYDVPTGGTSLGTGTTFATPDLSVTMTYYVDATGNGCTTTSRTAVIATINPIPVITGTTPASLCGPGTVTLGATASAGTINWYDVSTGGTSLGTGTIFTTPSLSVTKTYYVDATENGCTTTSRTAVIATINTIPATPLVSVDCSLGFNHAVVTVTYPVGAGYEYSINGGTTYQSDPDFTEVVNGSYIIIVRNTSGCTSTGSSFDVSCGCVNGPTVTLSSTSGVTCGTTPKTVSGNSFGGSASGVTITENGSGTVSPGIINTTPFAFTYTPAAGDIGNIITITITTDNPLGAPCAEATATYTLTVNATPAITGTSPASRCGPGTVTLGATASAGTINWYNVSTGGTSLSTGTTYTTPDLSVTTTYYVDATANGCTTASRTAVVATINPIPVITGITPASRCETGTVILGATASTGTINWYNVPTGGTSLGTGTTFTTPIISVTTTYYVDATANGCTTPSRTAVIAAVNTIPSITGIVPASRCGSGTVTLGASSSAGAVNWYSVPTGGTSLIIGTAYTTPNLTVTTTYYVDATYNGCTTLTRTPVTASIYTLPGAAGPITGPATFIPGATGVSYSVADIAGVTSYLWSYTGTGVTINGSGANVTLDFTLAATNGQLKVYGHNICGNGTESVLDLSPATKTLNLTVYLEGLYNGAGGIVKVQDCDDGENSYDIFTGTISDTLTVQIAQIYDPYLIIHTEHGVPINTDGAINLNAIPGNLTDSYYIIIKHRNHVETWSQIMSFTGQIIDYNFTDAISKAWGNNMVHLGSVYCIYTGDTNKDQYVDGFDLALTFNLNRQGSYGYQVSDINGDGFIDGYDLAKVFNNNKKGVGMNTPANPLEK